MLASFPPSARVCARDVSRSNIGGQLQSGFPPSALTGASYKNDERGQRPSGFPPSALTGEESGSGAGFSPFRSRGELKSNGVGGKHGSGKDPFPHQPGQPFGGNSNLLAPRHGRDTHGKVTHGRDTHGKNFKHFSSPYVERYEERKGANSKKAPQTKTT